MSTFLEVCILQTDLLAHSFLDLWCLLSWELVLLRVWGSGGFGVVCVCVSGVGEVGGLPFVTSSPPTTGSCTCAQYLLYINTKEEIECFPELGNWRDKESSSPTHIHWTHLHPAEWVCYVHPSTDSRQYPWEGWGPNNIIIAFLPCGRDYENLTTLIPAVCNVYFFFFFFAFDTSIHHNHITFSSPLILTILASLIFFSSLDLSGLAPV